MCLGLLVVDDDGQLKKRLLGSGPAKLQRIGLETGVVSRGWSPEPYPDEEIVLQLGLGNKTRFPSRR